MRAQAKLSSDEEVLPLRTRYREEMNCQIVHDSIHRREGWTLSYLLDLGGITAGFGSIAIGGPWKDKPTVFEFYVLPEHRSRAFVLFEAFLAASRAPFFEVQTNDALPTVMALTYGQDIGTEKIVFHDRVTTAHLPNAAILRRVTSEEELRMSLEQRQGGGEWLLEVDGNVAATGGILFHYNRPYGDIYMEVTEPFRRRGLGSYLVQELKRVCYELGAIPCARCNTTNIASRRTLQRAGFVPVAHILIGSIASA
ncbi:MAG TPA: GNAT family N-acetyltransferase [Pyrinomonadaceae bacterium]|nr:GNAT family N-acetyltransferase [Pyrinomonadaceae bacterium]